LRKNLVEEEIKELTEELNTLQAEFDLCPRKQVVLQTDREDKLKNPEDRKFYFIVSAPWLVPLSDPSLTRVKRRKIQLRQSNLAKLKEEIEGPSNTSSQLLAKRPSPTECR
jgi:hypothetical protein